VVALPFQDESKFRPQEATPQTANKVISVMTYLLA